MIGALWMLPSLGASPAAAGARLDAWLKTAGFQSLPLIELKEGGYRQRTLRNVLESDGTAILYFAQIEGEAFATLRSHPYNGYACTNG